jgi:hypothetical protein
MTTMRKLGVALAVLVTLLFAGTLYYFMPRATKVSITKTETKIRDQKDPATGETRSRDVGLVYAVELKTGEALAFRNEDNGWYFKFDSEDVAAQASKFATLDTDKTVLLRYYGLRIPILDMFPNVLSLKQVDSDHVYVPWVNMVILIVLLILFVWAGVKVRHLFSAAKTKLSKRPDAS